MLNKNYFFLLILIPGLFAEKFANTMGYQPIPSTAVCKFIDTQLKLCGINQPVNIKLSATKNKPDHRLNMSVRYRFFERPTVLINNFDAAELDGALTYSSKNNRQNDLIDLRKAIEHNIIKTARNINSLGHYPNSSIFRLKTCEQAPGDIQNIIDEASWTVKHEAGHIHYRHGRKEMVVAQLLPSIGMVAGCLAANKLCEKNTSLTQSGAIAIASIGAGAFAGVAINNFIVHPWISRLHEEQADNFGIKHTTNPKELLVTSDSFKNQYLKDQASCTQKPLWRSSHPCIYKRSLKLREAAVHLEQQQKQERQKTALSIVAGPTISDTGKPALYLQLSYNNSSQI